MERVYCQSCGMPLVGDKELGTNADGSTNTEYCIYCFEGGKFKDEMTMEEMITFCIPHMVEHNPRITKEEVEQNMNQFFPTLKRWKK